MGAGALSGDAGGMGLEASGEDGAALPKAALKVFLQRSGVRVRYTRPATVVTPSWLRKLQAAAEAEESNKAQV